MLTERITTTRTNRWKQIVLKNKVVSRDCEFIVRNTPNKVNLNAWIKPNGTQHNLGDWLSVVVVENTCSINGIDMYKDIGETRHLYGVGSILLGYQDATIWGSGFIYDPTKEWYFNAYSILHRYYHKTDVRAIRGPETRDILLKMGIVCPEVYGDPAVLMPLFYHPAIEKTMEYLVIPHFVKFDNYKKEKNKLGSFTTDYRKHIDIILSAKRVISSSLHGIILAEAYGIPAIMLNDTPSADLIKYRDWYYSTGRQTWSMANSIEEALSMDVAPLDSAVIKKLQQGLMDSFPVDLWEIQK